MNSGFVLYLHVNFELARTMPVVNTWRKYYAVAIVLCFLLAMKYTQIKKNTCLGISTLLHGSQNVTKVDEQDK